MIWLVCRGSLIARVRLIFLACSFLVLSACNLRSRSALPDSGAATNTPDGPPVVVINSPSDGDEFVVGEEILVSVDASDSIGVNRVQLFVDNQIVRTVSSESLQGDLSMQAILNYVPQTADLGSIDLRVLAYRDTVVGAADEITVVVRQSPADIVATPASSSNLPFIPDDDICRALVNVGLNFRTGPSTGYAIIAVLDSGTLTPITGQNSANTWWQLDVNGRSGWVSADFTTEYGDCAGVPVIADP